MQTRPNTGETGWVLGAHALHVLNTHLWTRTDQQAKQKFSKTREEQEEDEHNITLHNVNTAGFFSYNFSFNFLFPEEKVFGSEDRRIGAVDLG